MTGRAAGLESSEESSEEESQRREADWERGQLGGEDRILGKGISMNVFHK